MDYKEAIEELESLHRHCSSMIDDSEPGGVWRADCKALDMAISAMQELYEYKNKLEQVYGKCEGLLDKVIDTLVQFADEVKIGNPIESLLLTDEEVELWKQIEKLGTLEEVCKAVEKQKAEKPKAYRLESHGVYDGLLYCCPNCECSIIKQDNRGFLSGLMAKHCLNCGQKLDWMEVEE